MYLRETRRTNRDGSVVSYLQLAHNERHPVTGNSTAKVIHNFGRAEKVDRDALARLVASISRFLTPEQAMVAAAGARGGGAGLPPAGRGVGAGPGVGAARDRRGGPPGRRRAPAGRRAGGAGAVRAGRPAGAGAGQQAGRDPVGRPSGSRSRADRVRPTTQAYRGMDFLLDALDEIAGEIFASVAHLLNLDLDIVFVDTTSTYWEVDVADELADLAEPVPTTTGSPGRSSRRRAAFGHSKDHRERPARRW